MKQYEIKREGFSVIHNSDAWRLAVHGYDEKVNGLSALQTWGRHLDSEEAFVLLSGRAWLSEREEDSRLRIEELKPMQVYLVETGVRHAIVLQKETYVLIAENRDMDRTVTEPVTEEEKQQISTACAN